ncbi:MAG TPA: hypothetical protein VME43_33235 [Bryobacteraceae bacterium]|nr:hypothetical protein [Bryobacteraceae bacterium]
MSLPRGYVLEKYLGEEEGAALYLTSYAEPAGQAAAPEEPDIAQTAPPVPRQALLKLVAGHSAVAGQLTAWERLMALSHPNLQQVLDCGRAGPLGPHGGHYLYAVFEYPDDHLESAVEAAPLSDSDARDVLAAAEAALEFLHAHGLAHTSVDARHIVAVGDRILLSADTVKPLGLGATEAADWKACGGLRRRLLGEAGGPAVPVEDPEPPASRRTLPVWGYAAIAAAVLLLLVVMVRPKSAQTRSPQVATAYVPAEVPTAPTVKPASLPSVQANWRVVAYTYMHRKDADHKVAQINARYPGFVPEVFSPKGSGQPPYLVALGGRMTRAQARILQRQALAKGMPHGTYVQNFTN